VANTKTAVLLDAKLVTSGDRHSVVGGGSPADEGDRALAYFGQAIDERSTVVRLLKREPLPAPFQADPRYHVLLRRIGLE